MRLDFWNTDRDKKIELSFKWVVVLTIVVIIVIVWTFSNFSSIGEAFSQTNSYYSPLPVAYEFDRGCEILSEVYHCNPDAWLVIKPSEVWGYQVSSYENLNLLYVCQSYLRNPLADVETCVKACWQCSDVAPGSTCTNDEDCQKLLGGESKCVHIDNTYSYCTYRNLTPLN